jgi:chromate transporter
MGFTHMLPGPEALQLAIYVGYLKRGILGGILAGLTFIIPGAAVMILLSWLYVTYGSLPQVNDALYILKPAVLGIIAAGIIKLGRAAIKNWVLAGLLVGAILAMWLGRIDFLLVLLAAGILNMLISEDIPRLRTVSAVVPLVGMGLGGFGALAAPQWLEMIWVFLKTGLFSFGGAYASMAFLQRDAVDRYHWLTAGQLLNGVALSVATPGPFMLFTTFAGYLAGGLLGVLLATFFVFLPSFVLVLIGAPYIEQVRHNRRIQAFLAGASAGVVGVILVVSLPLMPEAFVDLFSIAIGVATFLTIVPFKVDVALVAVAAIVGGIAYAAILALAGRG